MKEQLVFVYNADSNLFSIVSDFAHKILSPSTYDCKLCALTYGNFSMKQEWKAFIESLPATSMFLHKDEFIRDYQLTTALPAIFLSDRGSIYPFISRQELENCDTLQALKKLITQKLNEHVERHHSNVQ